MAVTVQPGQKHFEDSTELCRYVRALTGETVLLSFSYGKDSVACWLRLKEHFPKVLPFYFYPIPDRLDFIERSLAYYEEFFKTPIVRLVQPSFFRWLDTLMYQPPERVKTLQHARFHRTLEPEDWEEHLREKHELPNAYVAMGVRAADSAIRQLSIKKNGPINHKRQSFFPVYDWKQQHLLEAFAAAKVKMSPDYRDFGRTFDGLQWDFIEPVKRLYPADYERIRFWFPMVDSVLLRWQWAEKEVAREARPHRAEQPKEDHAGKSRPARKANRLRKSADG